MTPNNKDEAMSGVRWVAEWYPHEATWIAWPHNAKTWPERIHLIPPVFEKKIRILAEVETVHVLAGTGALYEQASTMLADCERVVLHRMTTNDCWIRDFGPTFVLEENESRLVGVDWRYNAWGGKYHPHDTDAANAQRICESLGCGRHASRLTCEGGGLETDGEGTLLCTSSSIVTCSRNPGWSVPVIEAELSRQLGVTCIHWIDGGELAGDDTDSHIDQLVRFVRPGVCVAAVSSTSDDSNARHLETQWQNLQGRRDAKGRALEFIRLRTPPPRFVHGVRVPESYCNFYIANGIVLVPQFGFRETDQAAMAILGDLFPSQRMVPLDASELIYGRGAFHCATQQQPSATQQQPSATQQHPSAG